MNLLFLHLVAENLMLQFIKIIRVLCELVEFIGCHSFRLGSFLFLVNSIQLGNVLRRVNICLAPAGKNPLCIFKTVFVRCQYGAGTCLQNDILSEGIFPGPAIDVLVGAEFLPRAFIIE